MPSPMINATLQASILSSISNIIAQFIQAHKNKTSIVTSFNGHDLFRFVLLSLLTAPPNFKWQQLLEQTFPAYPSKIQGGSDKDIELGSEKRQDDKEKKPKLNLRNTLTKWFIDCITLGALFNTIAFLVIMGLLKGQSQMQIQKNIRTETIPIIVAGYKVWPFASIISFSCIPVERRIVFLSFIGLCWGVYMSLVAARV